MFEKVNVRIVGRGNTSYLLNEERGKKNHLFGEGGGGSGCPLLLGEIPLHEEVRLGEIMAPPGGGKSRKFSQQ